MTEKYASPTSRASDKAKPALPMERAEAIAASKILDSLWWDILAGDGLLQEIGELQEKGEFLFKSEAHKIALQRMVFSHLLMVLCKLAEFHDRYSRYLPDPSRMWLGDIKNIVERREIRMLRNKFIGHILDDDTEDPLPSEKVDERFERAMGGKDKSEEFCSWMRNEKDPGDLATVMGQVIEIRKRIMEDHGLEAADLGLDLGSSSFPGRVARDRNDGGVGLSDLEGKGIQLLAHILEERATGPMPPMWTIAPDHRDSGLRNRPTPWYLNERAPVDEDLGNAIRAEQVRLGLREK